jgi:hypothetical protein
MLRGRCVFNSIEDIRQTVNKIKRYVNDNVNSYRIVQIESRFGKRPPISDVTLKIAIE